jgi:hypothetical protein
VGDYDGDERGRPLCLILVGGPHKAIAHLYPAGAHLLDVAQRAGASLPAGAIFATFADVHNDGRLDLFAIGGDQRAYLLHNSTGAGGKLEDVTAKSGITNIGVARKALFADLDHDGDLVLLLVGGPSVLYRNNLDGTFTEMAFGGGATRSRDDDDLSYRRSRRQRHGASLYHNDGNRHFSDVIASDAADRQRRRGSRCRRLQQRRFVRRVHRQLGGNESSLWLNNGNGTFRRDTLRRLIAAIARCVAE